VKKCPHHESGKAAEATHSPVDKIKYLGLQAVAEGRIGNMDKARAHLERCKAEAAGRADLERQIFDGLEALAKINKDESVVLAVK
jgi:hypothetical protein